LKHAKHVLKFAFNSQAKVIATFVDDQAEVLARYEYNDAHIPQRKLGVNLLNSNTVNKK